jgi:hypothetical protein
MARKEKPQISADTDTKLGNAEMFIEFYYPEIKDLGKHFLTIVSGVLAFSVTFSEKIIGFPNATLSQFILLVCSWVFFIVAIIAAGTGIYTNFVAANIANRAIHTNKKTEIKLLVLRSYSLLKVAGGSFIIGLMLLASSAIAKFS